MEVVFSNESHKYHKEVQTNPHCAQLSLWHSNTPIAIRQLLIVLIHPNATQIILLWCRKLSFIWKILIPFTPCSCNTDNPWGKEVSTSISSYHVQHPKAYIERNLLLRHWCHRSKYIYSSYDNNINSIIWKDRDGVCESFMHLFSKLNCHLIHIGVGGGHFIRLINMDYFLTSLLHV